MISKKYIKGLDFEALEDIFDYILLSEMNGQFNQAKELINKLSGDQYKEFIIYIEDILKFQDDGQTVFKKMINWRSQA